MYFYFMYLLVYYILLYITCVVYSTWFRVRILEGVHPITWHISAPKIFIKCPLVYSAVNRSAAHRSAWRGLICCGARYETPSPQDVGFTSFLLSFTFGINILFQLAFPSYFCHWYVPLLLFGFDLIQAPEFYFWCIYVILMLFWLVSLATLQTFLIRDESILFIKKTQCFYLSILTAAISTLSTLYRNKPYYYKDLLWL